MKLPKIDKPFILQELSKASLILAVLSGIPYSFGEVSDILGPQAKKWVTIIAASVSALAKFTQWTIQLVTAFTGAPVAPVDPPANPLMQNPPIQGPNILKP